MWINGRKKKELIEKKRERINLNKKQEKELIEKVLIVYKKRMYSKKNRRKN